MNTFIKFLLALIIFLYINTAMAQDYMFLKPNSSFVINKVEIQSGKIYLLGTESIGKYSIQIFDIDNNTYKTLYSSNELFNHRLTKITDIAFFENDIYVVNENKLINLSDNYKEYSFADEYDFNSTFDKYRQLHNITVRGNSLLIGSTSTDVLSRDTLQGTPGVYVENFNELLEFKSGVISRIINERQSKLKFSFNFSPVLDNQNTLWFCENQDIPQKGGLLSVNEYNEIDVYDLKSYSDKDYRIMPSSIDVVGNLIYISLFPRKESNYLEGLSIYNFEKSEWIYSIDYLTNNDIYKGINWEVPNKITKLKNGNLAILGYDFTIQYKNGYIYFDLAKTQKEKFGELGSPKNLDLYETESKYIIIRQNGILVFDKSTITNVEGKLITKYEYKINNNKVEFESDINNYKVYDLLGKVIRSGESGNTIDISNLITGPYFILLNEEYIIKFIKE